MIAPIRHVVDIPHVNYGTTPHPHNTLSSRVIDDSPYHELYVRARVGQLDTTYVFPDKVEPNVMAEIALRGQIDRQELLDLQPSLGLDLANRRFLQGEFSFQDLVANYKQVETAVDLINALENPNYGRHKRTKWRTFCDGVKLFFGK